MNTPLTQKVLILGIDGMDPSLTRKFLAEGIMPNTARFLQSGSAHHDLSMLGGVPTITPPMWTTLSTGATPATHGITCFWGQSHKNLDAQVYALDSRLCKAEPLWNVLTEAGKKTLVWHWPGSSWPPTSESPLLHVVDGTQPAVINMGVATVDNEKIIRASVHYTQNSCAAHDIGDSGAGCIMDHVDAAEANESAQNYDSQTPASRYNFGSNSEEADKEKVNIMFTYQDGEGAVEAFRFDQIQAPITAAEDWPDLPPGAKVFDIMLSRGFIRRYGLLLPNEAGIYDCIALYKNKRDKQPFFTLYPGLLYSGIVDEATSHDQPVEAFRSMKILRLAPDGSEVDLWISSAVDLKEDKVWHPRSLMQDVYANVGLPPFAGVAGGAVPQLVQEVQLAGWEAYAQWQASALNYLIQSQQYDVIFSHLHNIDAMGHNFLYLCKTRERFANDEALYQRYFAEVYQQTDRYLGRFLPLLEDGWTIIITSDHGLLCQEEEIPLIGDNSGVNVRIMEALGYTTLLKDKQGADIKAIDWANTRAIANRGNHIWINLKGRNQTGIVEPEAYDALVEQIIDDLYRYQDPQSGSRVIALALKNKDAAIVGLDGPESGDILYWVRENFNRVHGDSLPTFKCYFDASVSPIFIAAGSGIKANYTTGRVIRETDVAPTVAVLMGVRMPKDCEGAPVYQILSQLY